MSHLLGFSSLSLHRHMSNKSCKGQEEKCLYPQISQGIIWGSTIASSHPVTGKRGVRKTVKTLWPPNHMDIWCILASQWPDIPWCPDAKTGYFTTLCTVSEQKIKPSFQWDLFLLLRDFWQREEIGFSFLNSLCNQFHKFT